MVKQWSPKPQVKGLIPFSPNCTRFWWKKRKEETENKMY